MWEGDPNWIVQGWRPNTIFVIFPFFPPESVICVKTPQSYHSNHSPSAITRSVRSISPRSSSSSSCSKFSDSLKVEFADPTPVTFGKIRSRLSMFNRVVSLLGRVELEGGTTLGNTPPEPLVKNGVNPPVVFTPRSEESEEKNLLSQVESSSACFLYSLFSWHARLLSAIWIALYS